MKPNKLKKSSYLPASSLAPKNRPHSPREFENSRRQTHQIVAVDAALVGGQLEQAADDLLVPLVLLDPARHRRRIAPPQTLELTAEQAKSHQNPAEMARDPGKPSQIRPRITAAQSIETALPHLRVGAPSLVRVRARAQGRGGERARARSRTRARAEAEAEARRRGGGSGERKRLVSFVAAALLRCAC